MAAVQTLGLEVAVVQAAAGHHEHVRHAARRLGPVHGAAAPRPARRVLHLDTVRAGLHEGDGVTIAAPPPRAALPGLLEKTKRQ